jgi:hypothetical protein
MNGANVKVAWTLSDQPSYSDGGKPITEYDVQFLHGDGTTYSSESANCAASSATLANLFCEIPMTVFTASPYSLGLGALIQAKVAARNAIGLGAYSTLNSAGVLA